MGESRLIYTCSREFRENLVDPENEGEYTDYWKENCDRITPDNKVEQLWSVSEGVVEGKGTRDVVVPQRVGLLTVDASVVPTLAPYLNAVRRVLSGIRRTSAGVPRSAARRRAIWLRQRRRRRSLFQNFFGASTRLESMLLTIVRWVEREDDRALAFERLMETLHLPSKLELHNTYVPGDEGSDESSPTHVRVLLDGEDVGYLSDGTLRSMEIIVALLSLRESSTLLIEEPETAIHPALLQRLLSVIETYSDGVNVVISTHSPLVVDWAEPGELRFVARKKRNTVIASMSAQEQDFARAYLQDEGTLGEFVFQEDGEDYHASEASSGKDTRSSSDHDPETEE